MPAHGAELLTHGAVTVLAQMQRMHTRSDACMRALVPSQGRVVSGHQHALERMRALAQERGALKVTLLAVSGAFHTRLMEPARDKLLKVRVDAEGVGLRMCKECVHSMQPHAPASQGLCMISCSCSRQVLMAEVGSTSTPSYHL